MTDINDSELDSPMLNRLQKKSQPLKAYGTPYNAQYLQSVISPLWRKSNWLHATMDPIFKEDTREPHWKLNCDESIELLGFLFPNKLLFPKSLGVLAENRDHYSIKDIIQHCQNVNALGNPDQSVSIDNYRNGGQQSGQNFHDTADGRGETVRKGKAERRGGTKGKTREPPHRGVLKEMWLGSPPLHPEAPSDCEAPLVDFMNNVLEIVKQACNL
ncbi:hypothetical protein OG21DRAFT_1527816 [Imleria badia]|nr:hypothetical protein OG21DRAFT_1527816 [Imleria badia]